MLSEDEFRRLAIRLVEFGHTFVPVDVSLLYSTLAARAFQVDATVLHLLDALADPAVTLDGAVSLAVGLLRELASSRFGHSAVAAVATLSLDRIAAGRDVIAVARLFLAHVNSALRLFPQDRDVVFQCRVQDGGESTVGAAEAIGEPAEP